MDAINTLLTRCGDLVFGLSARWPLATLVAWSAVAGVAMAVVFRFTSNQQGLRDAADRSRAAVLAVKLFGHDLRAMFASLGQLLRYTGLRLWYSLPPVLVMLVPLLLILVQFALRYEYRPLAPGTAAVVRLELDEKSWPRWQRAAIEAPANLRVETPALRDAAEHALYWRIRASEAAHTAPAVLDWQLGDATTNQPGAGNVENQIVKQVAIAADDALATVSTRRPGRGLWDRVLNPAEPALAADSPARGIDVDYPRRATPIWGYDVPWWLTFFVVSIVAALAARPLVGVRF